MATETLPAEQRPDLASVAHTQTDALFDVKALLTALVDATEFHGGDTVEELHDTMRLATMARTRVTAIIDAFNPYI